MIVVPIIAPFFVRNARQRAVAENSKQQLEKSGYYRQPIVTEIAAATTFWPAENYHQDFYRKNPQRYKQIKRARRQFLKFQQVKRSFYLGLNRLKRN